MLIDWPGLGAAPRGYHAAVSLDVLTRFRAPDAAPLVERFLAGLRRRLPLSGGRRPRELAVALGTGAARMLGGDSSNQQRT